MNRPPIVVVLMVMGSLGGAAPAAAQQNTKPPVIQGAEPRQEGQTLTARAGEWSQGTSVTRQWLRCDSAAVSSCAGIPGSGGPSYTLVPADVGKRIRIRETGCAVLPIFCNSADSEPTGPVLPDPYNQSPPTVSGTAREDETLSVASNGGWLTQRQPLSFTYQWRRCDATGGGCASIGGANGSGYTLTAADVGRTIRVAVTASNTRPRVSAPAESAPSAVVQPGPPIPPANVTPPLIGGTLTEGELIATNNGTWTGRPAPTFSYQWQRCRPECADLAGQTSQLYRLTSADVGARMRAVVTARNSEGADSVPSAQTAPIAARPASSGTEPGPPEATESLLTPFPLVVIAGRLFRSGARITLLGVRAPRGSSVVVRCRGRSCPVPRLATHVGRRGRLRVRRLQRLLRTGVVIEVFVTKPNRIGKYTRFRIRSRRRPARRDLCVFPGQRRPSPCPSL